MPEVLATTAFAPGAARLGPAAAAPLRPVAASLLGKVSSSWLQTGASKRGGGAGRACSRSRSRSVVAKAKAAASAEKDPKQYYKSYLPPNYYRATTREEVADGVWQFTQDLKLGPLGDPDIRMMVIRLESGKFWAVSAVAPTEECKRRSPQYRDFTGAPAISSYEVDLLPPGMEQLGAVLGGEELSYIVVPSTAPEHSMFTGAMAARFPGAEVWVPRHMERRTRGDLPEGRDLAGVLTEGAPPEWASEIDYAVLEYGPTFTEASFCHLRSGVAIFQDICFMSDGPYTPEGFLGEAAAKNIGIYKELGCPAVKSVFPKIPAKAKAWRAHVMSWDFDLVTPAHLFSPIPGGKAKFESCFAFVDELSE